MKKFSILLGLLAGIAFALQTPSSGAAEAVAMSVVGEDCIYCSDDRTTPGTLLKVKLTTIARSLGMVASIPWKNPCWAGSCYTKHGAKCGEGGGGTFTMVDMDRLRGSIEAKYVYIR